MNIPWWGTPAARGGVDFGHLKISELPAQVDAAIEHARTQVAQVRGDSRPASFATVISALEDATIEVDQLELVIQNLLSGKAEPELEKLSTGMLSKLGDFSNEVLLDADLFQRVEAAYRADSKNSALSSEERELLERTYREFVRGGVGLPAETKKRLTELDRELTAATRKYEEQALEATRRFELHLTSPAEVAGVPESWKGAAAAEAKKRGKEGWVVTLQYPSLHPFLTFADRRDLREKIWRASSSRGLAVDLNNAEVAQHIARLRFERANLLGFESHAQFTLAERMAERPETVRKFLDELMERARVPAEKELDELRTESGLGKDFQPWDAAYWSERLKKKRLDFDDEELRSYLPWDAVWLGMQQVVGKLFGVTLQEVKGVPVYDPEVTTWEVRVDGREVGLLYLDLFPRDTKQSGAWASSWREAGTYRGQYRGPHVGVTCNFPRPVEGRPALLGPQDVNTLFHEMGHALHGLLARGRLRSIAGFHVYWDFVELPSQVMEAWATHPDSVAAFARHWKTGEKPPRALLEKYQQAEKFLKGLFWIRQLRFAETDWAWHGGDPARFGSFAELEQAVRVKADLFPKVEGASISSYFNHIFGGGYAAGYYSYAWADVLAADAFEAFVEAGDIFHPPTARKFREEVLERGGSLHPAELYRRFRGRDADPGALLRRDGLA